MTDDSKASLLEKLKFIPSSEVKKPTDRMEKVRLRFIDGLKAQKDLAREFIKHPEKQEEKRKQVQFFKSGNGYAIEPKYGKRYVSINDSNHIAADSLEDVIDTYDTLIKYTQQRDPIIEDALAKVMPRQKATRHPQTETSARTKTQITTKP